MYLSILKETFIIWGIRFLISKVKLNIISGESLLYWINFIGISFVESKLVSFIECRRGISYYIKERTFFKLDLGVFPNF